MVNGTVRRERQGAKEERLAKLHAALVIIGSGLLRRNTEGGVRSEELGVVELRGRNDERKTLNVQRSTPNAQVRSP